MLIKLGHVRKTQKTVVAAVGQCQASSSEWNWSFKKRGEKRNNSGIRGNQENYLLQLICFISRELFRVICIRNYVLPASSA